jgi:hypothetical protein
LVSDSDAGQLEAGSQNRVYTSGVESNVLGVWWMGLAALQSDRQMQLLAKVLNDTIHLIVCHPHTEQESLPPVTRRRANASGLSH